MRILFYSITVLLLTALVGSCTSRSRLAKDVAGTWTGSPETLDMLTANDVTAITQYTFTRDDKENGGTVALTVMLEVSKPIIAPALADKDQMHIKARAVATIKGTWRAIDDDELFLTLDPHSVNVAVDPSTVELMYDNVATPQASTLETLKAGAAEQLKSELTPVVNRRYLSVHRIEDVKMRAGLLHWEVNDVDYALTPTR